MKLMLPTSWLQIMMWAKLFRNAREIEGKAFAYILFTTCVCKTLTIELAFVDFHFV